MKIRKSARAILKNKSDEFLLFRFRFKGIKSNTQDGDVGLWIVPGGGVDNGETLEQAVLREIEEETGFIFEKAGPLVWIRDLELEYLGETFVSEEYFFYFDNVNADDISFSGFSSNEKDSFMGAGWFSLDDLHKMKENLSPEWLSCELKKLEVELPKYPLRLK
jgi:8-oxo-dGTP pyrophosphatase MutT (NUDIX family)